MDFRSGQALRAAPETDQHDLAGTQLGDAEATEGFHMDKNVLGAFAARQETEALGSVEPFHQSALEPALGRHSGMRPAWHFGRMDRRTSVHRDDAKGLAGASAADDVAPSEGWVRVPLAECNEWERLARTAARLAGAHPTEV